MLVPHAGAATQPRTRAANRGRVGTIPLSVEETSGDLWQVNFRLPPGLDAGYHDVRVRTKRSLYSAPARIAIDVPPGSDGLVITGVCDGKTWKRDEVRVADEGVVSIWVEGLPENADVANTEVLLGVRRLRVDCLVREGPGLAVQVNAILPGDCAPGPASVLVKVSNTLSQPVRLTIRKSLSGDPG